MGRSKRYHSRKQSRSRHWISTLIIEAVAIVGIISAGQPSYLQTAFKKMQSLQVLSLPVSSPTQVQAVQQIVHPMDAFQSPVLRPVPLTDLRPPAQSAYLYSHSNGRY